MKVNVLHTAVDWQSTVAADCTNSSNSPCSCPQSWQLSSSPSSCDSSVASTFYPTLVIILSSAECSAQGQVLHCMRRNLRCSSAEGRSSIVNSGIQGCSFTRDWIGSVVSRCFPHPTLSLASEQTLKDLKSPRVTNEEIRRMDLANWALRTSPKLTTLMWQQYWHYFSSNPCVCNLYQLDITL